MDLETPEIFVFILLLDYAWLHKARWGLSQNETQKEGNMSSQTTLIVIALLFKGMTLTVALLGLVLLHYCSNEDTVKKKALPFLLVHFPAPSPMMGVSTMTGKSWFRKGTM